MPQINEFPELITLADNDLLLIWDNSASMTAKVQLSTLKTFLGTTNNVSFNTKELTYTADGDANGLCYFLGTDKGSTIWQNPTNLGLIVSASSIEFGVVSQLVDRSDTIFYTPNVDGSWIKIDLLQGNSLQCNRYAIKSHNAGYQYHPRNFKLQGSNDDITWSDLDIQINNPTLVNSAQWLSIPVTSNESYRYLRILAGQDSNGSYYFILGEIEFYGIYKYQA